MAFDFFEAFNTILLAMVKNPFYMIFLIIGLFMIPLSLFGIVKIYEWVSTWQKLRAGWIKIRKKMSNGRWIEFWAKPTGRKVKLKGEEGMEFELPVRIEKDYMGYQSKIKGNFKTATPSAEELRDIVKGKTEGLEREELDEEIRIDKVIDEETFDRVKTKLAGKDNTTIVIK